MGFGTTVSNGPGNTENLSIVRQFLAGEACAKGEVVAVTTDEGSIYTVENANSGAATSQIAVGVALEDAASGEWFDVCVGGYCGYVLTDGAATEGNALVPHTVDGEATLMAAGEEHLVFGYALENDHGTTENVIAYILPRFA